MRSPVPIPSAVASGTCLSPSPGTPEPRDRLAQAEGSWSDAGKGGPSDDAPGGAGGGGRAPAAPLGAFGRAVRAGRWGVTRGRARVPLPRPRLTPVLEKSQMFFGKRPEQAEAVGSLPLTQTRCLAPGLILPGDVPGSPQGWQPPARGSADGSPQRPGGLQSRRPGGHHTRHGSTAAAPAQGSTGSGWEICACVSSASHRHVICISRGAPIPSRP